MAIEAVSLAQSSNSIADKIRDLESFEEMFWLFEHSFPVFPVVLVEVEGATTEEAWRAGLNALQGKYPMLSASVRKHPGERPYFVRTQGIPVPLRIEPWSDTLVLHGLLEEALQKSFGDGSGPLARVRLLHGAARSVVMLSAHHCAFDGKSTLLMMQDLIAAVAGEKLGVELQVHSFHSLFDQPTPADYTKILDGQAVAPPDGLLAGLPPVKVDRLLLSEQETATLIKRAKEENTTVHAALMVALALAARNASDSKMEPVSVLTPIDVRRHLESTDIVGMLITICVTAVDISTDLPFWARVRSAREDVLPFLSREGTLSSRKITEDMVAEEHTARGILQVYATSETVHELNISNYAGQKMRIEYGNLGVTSLLTGSIGPEHKIDVMTMNGRLGMTLISRQMPSNLLEDARKILVSQ